MHTHTHISISYTLYLHAFWSWWVFLCSNWWSVSAPSYPMYGEIAPRSTISLFQPCRTSWGTYTVLHYSSIPAWVDCFLCIKAIHSAGAVPRAQCDPRGVPYPYPREHLRLIDTWPLSVSTGIYVEEILNKWRGDYEKLEHNHTYIQWWDCSFGRFTMFSFYYVLFHVFFCQFMYSVVTDFVWCQFFYMVCVTSIPFLFYSIL